MNEHLEGYRLHQIDRFPLCSPHGGHMKTICLLLVGLLCLSVVVHAGEVITNDTGEDATGLRVSFSSPVLITAFGDILTSVDPQMLSFEFVFSGGTVEPWGSHWMTWAPATTQIIEHEWLPTETLDKLDSPSTWLYEYIGTERERYGEGPFSIPVFVSLPPGAELAATAQIECSDGTETDLAPTSTGILMAQIEIRDLPATVSVRVIWDGEAATGWLQQEIDNSFQVISIGVPELPGFPAGITLPEGFRTALMPTDVWGSFVYGRSDDTHTREHVNSTLQRITETGASDVFIVSFLGWGNVSPLPMITVVPEPGGTVTISEEDLTYFTARAHSLGLSVTLRFFGVMLNGRDDLRPILQQHHSLAWMSSFFDQYTDLMLEQAEAATRAGVDVFMLNLDDAGLHYDGSEVQWAEGICDLVEAIRQVFPGEIGYDLRLNDVSEILNGKLPLARFLGIDTFYLGNTLTRGGYPSDSVQSFQDSFERFLSHIPELRSRLGNRPLFLGTMTMSYEGFAQQGYINAVVLREDERRPPDFLAQVRYLEGLYRFLAESRLFDGIVAGWCHWDDPFGPDLPGDSLAHMDLGMSVRNKPAEALLKRWLGGSNEMEFPCEAPPCKDTPMPSPSYEVAASEIADHVLIIDDFETSPHVTFQGWDIDYDSQEFHDPGSDPSASCEIAIAESGENSWLQLDYTNNSWLAVRYWGFAAFDATAYAGIEMTLWIDSPNWVDITIGMTSEETGWVSARISGLPLDTSPSEYRFPFSSFIGGGDVDQVALNYALQYLINVSIHVPRGSGRINADNIRFYATEE